MRPTRPTEPIPPSRSLTSRRTVTCRSAADRLTSAGSEGAPSVTDRFDTAAIRGRVLDAWAAAPVRFREDANLEEDLVLGAYRDRVVIELAQNAADAATRAGQPGRLRLTLDSGHEQGVTLVVANTGTPLDAARVVGL